METYNLLIIDRIEGETAVCENEEKQHVEIFLSQISGVPREGDCLRPAEVPGRYIIDLDATAMRRKEMMSRQKRIFGKN